MKLVVKDQFNRIWWNLKERGVKEAWNYIKYRILFSVHSPIISNIINRMAPWPPYIEIEVSTKCTLRCKMCENTYWNEHGQNMSLERFKSIMKQFPRMVAMNPTGIGTNWMNPEYMAMLHYVKDRNIYLDLFDSFLFINEIRARELIVMGVNMIRPSLDAATAETYQKLRPGSDFKKVVHNLMTFFDLKKKMDRKLPEVAFHFIVSNDNAHEMVKYVYLVAMIAGTEHTTINFTEILHEYPHIKGMKYKVTENDIAEVELAARICNITIVWSRNTEAKKPPFNKCSNWTMPFIFVDGSVQPCCSKNEQNNRPLQKKLELGNVFETPFFYIWHGEKYRALRDGLNKNEPVEACQGCPVFERGV